MSDDGWLKVGSARHSAWSDRREQERRMLSQVPEPAPCSVAEAIARSRYEPVEWTVIEGIVTARKDRLTINDEPWAILMIGDRTDTIPVIVFPSVHAATDPAALTVGAAVRVVGRASQPPEIRARTVALRTDGRA